MIFLNTWLNVMNITITDLKDIECIKENKSSASRVVIFLFFGHNYDFFQKIVIIMVRIYENSILFQILQKCWLKELLKGYFITLFRMIIVIFTLLVLKQLHYFELLNVILSPHTMTKINSLSLINSHILFDDYANMSKMVRFSLEDRSEFGHIFVLNSHKWNLEALLFVPVQFY